MKSTIKLLLVVALFCGTAMAEGEMGSGGYTPPPPCTQDCPPPPPPCEENCLMAPPADPGTKKAAFIAALSRIVPLFLR